ncbi:MAG: GMC family oxidoreductase [Pseudomonadota bacterium]
MIEDGRSIPRGTEIECDICIVGAGIAGLAMAEALEPSGARIVLLESGGLEPGSADPSFNTGTSNDNSYPFELSRTRGLGGTSALWTGVCIPLDASDFEPRNWLPHSGWPIGLDTVEPFYPQASAFFGLPEEHPLERELDASRFASASLKPKPLLYAERKVLGPLHEPVLKRTENVRCILNATVTGLAPDAAHRSVTRIDVGHEGGAFSVAPRIVVLATGGIENARILLNAAAAEGGGIFNPHDVLGRYHMEHPIRIAAVLPLNGQSRDARLFSDVVPRDGVISHGTLGLPREIRDREGLLDLHLRFYRYSLREAHTAVVRGKALAEAGPTLAGVKQYLAEHAAALPGVVAPYLAWHAMNKLFHSAPFGHARMTALFEQEPDPENRITLSGIRDGLGIPLPHLHYRESAFMAESHRRSLALLRDALLAQGFGKLEFQEEALAHLRPYDKHGLHPMGSTRMADDPKQGVVDAECKMHGIENLFVTGSSVFPTGGAANPTLTIVALAFRLADRLRASLAQPSPQPQSP